MTATDELARVGATMVSSWQALAAGEPGATVEELDGVQLAWFPDCPAYDNALVDGPARFGSVATRAAALGAPHLAAWLPVPGAVGPAPGSPDGWHHDATNTAMLLDLAEPAAQVSLPEGVVVEQVPLGQVHRLAFDGSGMTPPRAAEAPHTTAWVLRLGGLAVSGVFVHRHRDDLGVYSMATLPPFRGNGLGGALLGHALATASRTLRLTTASLAATPLAVPMYERLGFRVVGAFHEYLHDA